MAKIAVVEYLEGTYKHELEKLTAEEATAREGIRRAEGRLERTRRARGQLNDVLATRGGAKTVPEIQAELDIEDHLEDAESTLDRERLALKQAQAKLEVLRKYTKDKMLKVHESEVAKAEADMRSKMATLELERSKEQKLEDQIKVCKLYASGDGPVVYANDPSRFGESQQPQIEEGASVRERQIIFRIPDLDAIRMNAMVREAIIDRVQRGQRARIQVDAFPNEILTGVVDAVAPRPDLRYFDRQGIKVYPTHVEIEDGPKGLRPGMTAEVEILLRELDDVLSVPIQAVLRYDDKWHVAVKRPGGGFDWREVILGVGDDEVVEVKQGINPGEAVALDPISLLSEEERRVKELDTPTKPATASPVPPLDRPSISKGRGRPSRRD